MKRSIIFLLILVISIKLSAKPFQYISPIPGSKFNIINSTIILKPGERIYDIPDSFLNSIRIVGKKSGNHSFRVNLSDDKFTIVITPFQPFSRNEKISVISDENLILPPDKIFDKFSFEFTTTSVDKRAIFNELKSSNDNEVSERKIPIIETESFDYKQNKLLTDTLPPDIVPITVKNYNLPSSGKIFISNWATNSKYGDYNLILDDSGKTVQYKKLKRDAYDFKQQPNGLFSYIISDPNKGAIAYVLDKDLNILDSVTCQSGYPTDIHEFLMLPNGHYILDSYDGEYYDMSKEIPNGNPNAILTGGIIQELDSKKNIVFQWRSWDYFNVTDSYADLTQGNISYCHLNSICYDFDGNLIVSFRNFWEIDKISRSTGDIIWRLGGKNNQFQFLNEHSENSPDYFTYQHDARRIENGNLTFFDNGVSHKPQHARAVEYKIDENLRTATLVWEFRHSPDIISQFMGNVQRLKSGNTLICWGYASLTGQPLITEVHPDNSIASEFSLPQPETSYRAYKFELPPCQPVADVVISNLLENNSYTFTNSSGISGVDGIFTNLNSGSNNNYNLKRYDCAPVYPVFDETPRVTLPYKLVISTSQLNSYIVEFHVDIDRFPLIKFPGKTYAYISDETGIFKKVSTTYDSINKKLVFNYSGEGQIIFGIPNSFQKPAKPILIRPFNNFHVNINYVQPLKWSPIGEVEMSEFRVASDPNYNNLALHDSVTSLTFYNLNLTQALNQTFYWSVRTKNAAGYSDWSDTWVFTGENPYIQLVTPNGGESVKSDSSYVIRWNDDIKDNMKIELFKAGAFYENIVDTIYSFLGGYRWVIPKNIPSGFDYKIKITNLKNNNLSGISQNNFSINITDDVDDNLNTWNELFIYPNPSKEYIYINLKELELNDFNINIYDSFGKLYDRISFGNNKEISDKIKLNIENYPQGIYFVTVITPNKILKSNFMVLK